MISLLVFFLVVYGIAWGLGASHLSFPFRKRIAVGKGGPFVQGLRGLAITLLECPACVSWHLGWLAYVLHLVPQGIFQFWWEPAFCCTTTSLILARLAGMTDLPPSGSGAHDNEGS